MLKLVSNKNGDEIHHLEISENGFTIEPSFEGVQELLSGLTDKQQILNALSGFNRDYVWAVTYNSDASLTIPPNEYSLSVVNIVPDTHKDAINQIAEIYGCGPNNLSVKLQGADSIFRCRIKSANCTVRVTTITRVSV